MQMINRFFNQFIIKVTPLLPRFIVWNIARRYVAGKNITDVLAVVRQLNDKGYTATVDILGEHTKSEAEANEITNEYLKIYDKISKKGLDCNISIKPSHIGLDINNKILQTNLDKLLNKAEETHNFLRIDMENSVITDITISLFKTCYEKYQKVINKFCISIKWN